jgi:hypothetical protein
VLLLVFFKHGLGDDGGALNWWQKAFVFYRAPFVKYVGNVISFIVLVLLYSYVALFGYRWQFQIPEIVLYVWILILFIDELREVSSMHSHTIEIRLPF